MSKELPIPSRAAIATGTSSGPILPAVIANVGNHATHRFIEFFIATIRMTLTGDRLASMVPRACVEHCPVPGFSPRPYSSRHCSGQ